MDYLDTFKKFGFDDKEAKIYLSLLNLNEATASNLSKHTGIERVNTYNMINKLINKGVVSSITKKNVKYFRPTDPRMILSDLQEIKESYQKILPDLIKKYEGNHSGTHVEVFQGNNGVKKVHRIILNDNKNYQTLGGAINVPQELHLEFKIWINKLWKKGIKGEYLENENTDFFVGHNETFRLLNDQMIPSSTVTVWGDKTAFFIWTYPFYVILIHNKDVAMTNKQKFRELWKIAKIPSKLEKEKRLIK